MNRFFVKGLWHLPVKSLRNVLQHRFDRVLRSDSRFRGVAFLDNLLVEIENEPDGGIREIVSHTLDSLAPSDNRF